MNADAQMPFGSSMGADDTSPWSGGLRGLVRLVPARMLATPVFSALLAHAATLASAALGAWLVGQAVSGIGPRELIPGFWLLGVSVVVAAGARWWQSFVAHDLAFALIETLQLGIYDGLERAAPRYVLGRRTGELATVATADAELMELFYAHMIADYVCAALIPLAGLILLACIHPLVALALLPFPPLLASVPFWFARRAGEQGRALLGSLGGLNAEVVEVIQGQRELAIFGAGERFLQGLMQRTRSFGAEQRRYGARSGLEHASIDVLVALAMLVGAAVGALLVGHGSLPLSLLAVVIVVSGALLAPVTEVTQTARKLGEIRAGAARVLTIFHQKPQIHDRGLSARPAGVSVAFRHVGFGYGAGRGLVLNDVSFTIEPGETVALVGRSGAGKSTCANLLLRFWDTDSGSVCIGGTDLRDLPLATLRSLVGVVPQDVHLFDETVTDNIRLGRPNASLAEVERAARIAQAHDFILALPQGYATRCGERGARLSGGQRQRLAIARALVRDAPILVMDEAVSSLDTENERALHAAMEEVRRNRAVLVIAHRLSTIRKADRILVLESGRIVEEGTHETLLALAGSYSRLIASPDVMA